MSIRRILILVASGLLVLAACDERPPAPEQETSTVQHSETGDPVSLTNSVVPPASPVPADTGTGNGANEALAPPSYTWISTARPLHYANVRRFQLRIRVQDGHSRAEIEQIMEQAAREARSLLRARAIDVLAFAPGDDATSVPTVGQGVLAPNGRWDDAHTRLPTRYRTVMLSERYFNPEADTAWRVGATIRLASPSDKPILLSRSSSSWHPEDEIASVAPGTEATLVRKKEFPSYGGPPIIRYRVEVLIDGAPLQGWVSQEAVEGTTPSE